MELLSEAFRKFADKVETLERENAQLRDELETIKGERRAHGRLADLPDVLTVQEVAKFLRVTDATVRALFDAGRLPKIGGGYRGKTIRVMKSDFIVFLEEERSKRPGAHHEETNVVPMVIMNSRKKKGRLA